ncbi:MAG: hypothetical protein OXC72_12070 [Roseovarius sp.]|nr:hypothetical protein [Roseovarius sp.]
MYRWRHQVGNFFARIREFRTISTRCEKTDVSYAAAIHPVSGLIAGKYRIAFCMQRARTFKPAVGRCEGTTLRWNLGFWRS